MAFHPFSTSRKEQHFPQGCNSLISRQFERRYDGIRFSSRWALLTFTYAHWLWHNSLLLVNHQLFALNQYVMIPYPWLLWHYRCLTIFRECSTSVVHYTSIIVWRSKRVDCCSVNQKIVPRPWKKEQGHGLARYITKALILFSLSLLLLSYLGWDQFLELPGNGYLSSRRRCRYFKRKCFENKN